MTLHRLLILNTALLLSFATGCPLPGEDDPEVSSTSGVDSDDDDDDDDEGETGATSTTGPTTTDATTNDDMGEGSTDTGTGGMTSVGTDPTGLDTSTTDDTSTSTTDDTGGDLICEEDPIADLKVAIAIRHEDLPDVGTTGGTTTTTGGDEIDPDALHIFVANHGEISCENPYGPPACGGELKWEVSVLLEPKMQDPGSTHTMMEAKGSESLTGPNQDADDCWFGFGTLWEGTVTIDAIDDQEVVGHFCDVDPIDDYNPNGVFVAQRC